MVVGLGNRSIATRANKEVHHEVAEKYCVDMLGGGRAGEPLDSHQGESEVDVYN